MTSFFAGFSLSLSLIMPIGSQNAFILKQGIKRHHIFVVCCICALSDALLMVCGILGFGTLVSQFPEIEHIARYCGAAFLFFYALLSFKSAIYTQHALQEEGELHSSRWKTIAACLAFTYLNPHVYLDTVMLIGSVSTQYTDDKLIFGLGAISSSIVFFFSLGYGARLLGPLFKQPKAWKILDAVVGLTMLVIASSLIFST